MIIINNWTILLWEGIAGPLLRLLPILQINGMIIGLMRWKSIGSFFLEYHLKVTQLPWNLHYLIDLNLMYHIDVHWINNPDPSMICTELQNQIGIFNWQSSDHFLYAILMVVFRRKLEHIAFISNSTEISMLNNPPVRQQDITWILHWANFEGCFNEMEFIPQSNWESILPILLFLHWSSRIFVFPFKSPMYDHVNWHTASTS
jgi:hypothetical protein